jgi:hypothetical protein
MVPKENVQESYVLYFHWRAELLAKMTESEREYDR